jgi:hypothetical protein
MQRKKTLLCSNQLSHPILLRQIPIWRMSHPKPKRRWRDKLQKGQRTRRKMMAGLRKKSKMAETGPRKSIFP